MTMMTLNDFRKAHPGQEAVAVQKFFDEVDKLPRPEKRGYNLALPGNDPMRFRGRRWRSKYGGWYGTYD